MKRKELRMLLDRVYLQFQQTNNNEHLSEMGNWINMFGEVFGITLYDNNSQIIWDTWEEHHSPHWF